ncbi:MAG: hypothetical protein M3R53_10020 [Candidatus Eremiobacteraeota bacterium]|nr:hypothetical protein [Candidatus Eremiobacteraeota bacterium]
MSNRIIELTAAAAIVMALPVVAAAQNVAYTTSPVAVTSCSVNETYLGGLPYGGAPQHYVTSGINLSYVNKSNVAAKTVKILMNDGDRTQTLVASGTFAPGVEIERNFSANGATSAQQNANCNVAEVDFADGSAWHAAPRNVATR